jgi:hypothetical protein
MTSPMSIERGYLMSLHLGFIILDDFSNRFSILIIIVIKILIISYRFLNFLIRLRPRVIIIATAGVRPIVVTVIGFLLYTCQWLCDFYFEVVEVLSEEELQFVGSSEGVLLIRKGNC